MSYTTDLSTGIWEQIGKPEFQDTLWMYSAHGNLYTIERTGHLYEMKNATGEWKQIGTPGTYQRTITGAVYNNLLYTIETSGGVI